MQKDSGQYKKLVAGIIVGIYAFVVFFAGFLHTHKADITFGTGTKVKMEKYLSSQMLMTVFPVILWEAIRFMNLLIFH